MPLSTDTQLHPGVVLRDRLRILGISQTNFAKEIGMSVAYVNGIVLAQKGLSVEMCLRLADYFYADDSDYWFRLQQSYDYEQFLTKRMLRVLDRRS